MLRAEANPLEEVRLFREQKDALRRLAALLEAAKAELPSKEFRTNRTIVINGVAGVGKTSVYLTLKERHEQSKSKDFLWLEPLELAILDRPSNALADLLTHIEEKCTPKHAARGKMNEEQEKVLRKLKVLQNDIALLWDGNPRERAARVQPESFAAEVARASRGRAKLRSQLNEIIDDLATHFFDKRLLILPVDGLHENPSVALDLLRLARLVGSRYLVFLAVGNHDTLQTIERLRARHELTRFLQDTDASDAALLEEVRERSEALAFFAMDKLFCPSQTISLLPADTDGEWEKIRDFRPQGDSEAITLAALLSKIRAVKLIVDERNALETKRANDGDSGVGEDALGVLGLRCQFLKVPARQLVVMHRQLSLGEGNGLAFNSNGDLDNDEAFIFEQMRMSVRMEYSEGHGIVDMFVWSVSDLGKVDVREEVYHVQDRGAAALPDPFSRFSKCLVVLRRRDRVIEPIHPTTAAWVHLLYNMIRVRNEKCAVSNPLLVEERRW